VKLGNREGKQSTCFPPPPEQRETLLDAIMCLASGYKVSSQGDEVGMYSDDHSTVNRDGHSTVKRGEISTF
jgi:hypothetical protein